MSVSAFFRTLRTSYQAELDDLASDSEGRDVLRKRLAQKRSQMAFLQQMMETAPEMVAVVFHDGFRFESPALMDHLLTLDSDDLPDWDSLQEAIKLEPWAQALAAPLLAEPTGSWFMTVAVALEYMYHKPTRSPHASDDQSEDDALQVQDARRDKFDADEDPDAGELDHEQAGADWLEEQGFDRKE